VFLEMLLVDHGIFVVGTTYRMDWRGSSGAWCYMVQAVMISMDGICLVGVVVVVNFVC